jgi:hypothetical protein
MTRLLLPFTSDVEMDILEMFVRLAANQKATLIPLSLISESSAKARGVRLEHLQQAQDFFEAVRRKAMRHTVPTEPHEIVSRDMEQSILQAAEQFQCTGILLAFRGERGALVNTEIIRRLLPSKTCSVYIVYFPAKARNFWRAPMRLYPGRQTRKAGFEAAMSKGDQLQPADSAIIHLVSQVK